MLERWKLTCRLEEGEKDMSGKAERQRWEPEEPGLASLWREHSGDNHHCVFYRYTTEVKSHLVRQQCILAALQRLPTLL